MTTLTKPWVVLGRSEEFAAGELRTWKGEGHQLVIGRTAEGELFALDNRCPHEGYPLAQGELKSDLLTCRWHNWKFRVGDGACVLGGEGVRPYPTREENGQVQADLSPRDPAEEIPALLESLRVGLFRHDNSRVFRDAARLLKAGFGPVRLAVEVAGYDAIHAEYGTTHALAVAADCLRFLPRYSRERAVLALAPAFDMCGEANHRLGPRPRAAARDWEGAGGLGEAIEHEDVERAEGMMRSAVRASVPRPELDAAVYGALSRHFTDFGHQLIYMVKLQELVTARGEAPACELEELYASLVHSAVLATREDTLPYWAPYAKRFQEVEGKLEQWHKGRQDEAAFDAQDFVAGLLESRPEAAHQSLIDALDRGVPAPRLARALVIFAAERLFRFDPAVDRNPEVLETWLWATHRFTFAAAARHAVERFKDPDALRFLFQSLAFTHSGHAMDVSASERTPKSATPATADEVVEAIAGRDATLAVARLSGHLGQAGHSSTGLREALEDLCLRDPLVRPIVVAHAIKTTVAAFEEYDALEGWEERLLPLQGLVRFLGSPIVERRVYGGAKEAIAWVWEDRMPRKLTQ